MSLHDKRTALARSFVSKLKDKLTAPESVAAGSIADDTATTQIPEGTDMLFNPRVDKLTLEGNIFAIKGADDFYLSLNDVISVFNFPITVSDGGKKASGWFIREDWKFNLDLDAKAVESRGQAYTLSEDDYQIQDNNVLIVGRLLSAWLGMKYEYDLSQQYVLVESEYPLPIVAQMKRRDRNNNQQHDNVAVLPRKEYDYEMARLSTADVSLRTNYRRSGRTGDTDLVNSTNIGLNGQLLKNDAQLFANIDDRDGLNSLTARLYRNSDRPELLGPLKARSYAVGDTETASVPLTGSSTQELGVRVSSNPLSSIDYQDTRITGNALPGWDIELYRNDALIDTLIVDETGRYEFNDVQLYAGDNFFDLYFYGSQGEVRKESLNIPLTADTLLAQNNTYDFSLTGSDTATYRREESQDEDHASPRLAGKYNFFVGDALAYAGFQAEQEEGKQKLYLGTGFTNIWNGFIFDTNLAADESSELAARFGARKNINDWSLALSTQIQTDEFTEGSGSPNPTVFQTQASAYRSYKPWFGLSGNVFADAQYRELADGGTGHTLGVGIGQGFQNFSLTNTLRYDEDSPAMGASTERFANDLSGRLRLSHQLSTRAGMTYLLRPESQMDRYFASINYRPQSNLNIDLDINHRPETRLTEAELRANYLHDKFRLSPFVRVDSENAVAAGLNLSTSLINVPYQSMPVLTGERGTNRGALTAHVFLDANGNSVFDQGDEPLPEVTVESVNSRSREKTNEGGYALLNQLSTLLPTDIRVDTTSLPDPFMIPINSGNSILPRAGRVLDMKFPVQFAGEIDGTVLMADASGVNQPVRSVSLILLPIDPAQHEKVTAKAAQDGFYLLSPVAPGQYFLTIRTEDAKALKAARPAARLMTFTHEGTTFYAQDLVMQQGVHDIDFEVLSPGYFDGVSTTEPEYYISLGHEKKSGPLQALYRLRMKDVAGRVVSGLQPVIKEGEDITYYRVGPRGLEAAYQRCQIMSSYKLPCQVSVLPAGAGDVVEPAAQIPTKQAAL